MEAAENEKAANATGGAERPRGAATDRVPIPAGKFVVGSTPGDKGRDPVLEPTLLAAELGDFSMDRYLYPNDPAKPPLTGVRRTRAEELCAAKGGRLCTDAEWERACKGPDNTVYPGGPAWDPDCTKAPSSCASGFGVLGLSAVREWTSTDTKLGEDQPSLAVVRGAQPDASSVDHRCAHRSAVGADSDSSDLGFRCCYGERRQIDIPVPVLRPQGFVRAEIATGQLRDMFASVPQLAPLGSEISLFKEPTDVVAVLKRANLDGAPSDLTLTTSPLLWNPVAGEELLIVAGRSKQDGFIVALYRLPDDRYRVASSFILRNDRSPIALGYNSNVRRKLGWGTCWDCNGESGNITYRNDNRVVITQK